MVLIENESKMGFFKCMDLMARDMRHPYIPSTTVLGDTETVIISPAWLPKATIAAHFSQRVPYSWFRVSYRQHGKCGWDYIPHQQPVTQPVITVALRLASGGWNESVHPRGSDLLQKQQRRGRAICLIVELDTSGKTLARLLSRLLSLHTWSKAVSACW